MKTKKILLIIMSLAVTFILTACVKNEEVRSDTVTKDREGNIITLPEKTERIISMGPSNTEILIALGFADNIIAADTYSEGISGLASDIPFFDMISPDGEQLIALDPDIIFVTGMSKFEGDDPFKAVSNAGKCIIYIPASYSIEGIKEDIRYFAEVMGDKAKGDEVISNMENEINAIKAIGDGITDKKSVYFEVSAPPYMCSFGKGVFLHEMLEIIGAVNILSDYESWITISDEQVLSANPDVILTCVNYIDNPIGELKSRAGWNEITAVKNDAVYSVDADASNRPSQNIIAALLEMSKKIYPEIYK